MTDETANLVLELLRTMRGDLEAMRREISELRTDMRERLEAVETQIEELRYVFVASVGSLVNDLKDIDSRVRDLEEKRA